MLISFHIILSAILVCLARDRTLGGPAILGSSLVILDGGGQVGPRRKHRKSHTLSVVGRRVTDFMRHGARAYQFALELRKPGKYDEHQSAVRGRRVGPCITKGAKPRLLVGNEGERIKQVAGAAGQAVKR